MNEIIKITENDGRKAVSARELYEKLGMNKAVWSRWYTKNIIKNPYAIENEDWVGFNIVLNGNESQDFALSLDFAKKLSMMARTEAGEMIRKYFIEVEKKSTIVALTPAEQFLRIAQFNVEHEKQIKELQERQENVENKLAGILELQAANEAELKALPLSSEEVPEMKIKSKVRLLVNKYAQSCNLAHQSVWDKVYQVLFYQFNTSIRAYKKINDSESWLDVAVRTGNIDKMHAVISEMVREKGISPNLN